MHASSLSLSLSLSLSSTITIDRKCVILIRYHKAAESGSQQKPHFRAFFESLFCSISAETHAKQRTKPCRNDEKKSLFLGILPFLMTEGNEILPV